MIKKLSAWSGALAIRITTEAKKLGWEVGDDINIIVKDDKIVIEKLNIKLKGGNINE